MCTGGEGGTWTCGLLGSMLFGAGSGSMAGLGPHVYSLLGPSSMRGRTVPDLLLGCSEGIG